MPSTLKADNRFAKRREGRSCELFGRRAAHHTGSEQRAAVVGVEDADEGERENGDGHGQDLGARAHAGGKQVEVRRRAENVAVDVLPARLFLLLSCRTCSQDSVTGSLHASGRGATQVQELQIQSWKQWSITPRDEHKMLTVRGSTECSNVTGDSSSLSGWLAGFES